MQHLIITFTVIALLIVVFFVLSLSLGTIAIPFDQVVRMLFGADASGDKTWRNIIWKSRYPQTITVLVAGVGLSTSGLQMQTVFRDPLAGPSEPGISSGASLGVATSILFSGNTNQRVLVRMGFVGEMVVSVAAPLGMLLVMSAIMTTAQRVRGSVVLLIMGVMTDYIANAIIGVLKFFSNDEDVHNYVIQGLGSFAKVSGDQVTTSILIILVLISLFFLPIKVLNLMLLGEDHVRSLGPSYGQARHLVISSACLSTVIVTAYCGPIVFIGLVVPHFCRTTFATSNHLILMPAVTFAGALLALCCNLTARMPGTEDALPVNSATTLIGAPIVIWILFDK